jgi:hypothetical protein
MINAASECLSKSPRVERLILIISIVKENRMNNPMTPLEELFRDVKLCEKIRRKLPFLFALAEQKVSRAGKAGMEVGTLREQILIALLIYKFGEARVDLDIPITEHEIDVRVSGYPLSIKTVTAGSRKAPTVKISWTVDWDKVKEFVKNYEPKCDMLLVIIRWEGTGGFYGIPLQAQRDVLEHLGKERYLKVPKRGTNPRGVAISSESVQEFLRHSLTKSLTIEWKLPADLVTKELRLAPYTQWLQYWESD